MPLPPGMRAFDANNHITGGSVQYDAAGNVTNDGTHTYTYDAENRIIKVDNGNTVRYYDYDAEGRRVNKGYPTTTTLISLFDLAGRTVTELDWYSNPARYEVYAGWRHLASYNNGTTYFSYSDHLGTERVRTNVSGAVAEAYTNLPFGDVMAPSTNGSSPVHFTGQDHDTETNLDHFWFRQYSSTQGRWMSPDPAGLAAVDLTNPQSLNRYTYVINQPTILVDPLGLYTNCTPYHLENCGGDSGTVSQGVDTTFGGPFGGIDFGPFPLTFLGGGKGRGGDPGPPVLKRNPANNTPCSAADSQTGSRYWTSWGDPNNPAWQRLKMLGTGLGNIAVGYGKAAGAAALETGSGGLATGIALYGVWSSSGNFAAGTLQAWGAFMPNPQPFNQGAQYAAAASSVSGLTTLAAGGSIDAAAQKAQWEGIFMSGFRAGATGNAPTLPQAYSGVLSTANSVSGGSARCK